MLSITTLQILRKVNFAFGAIEGVIEGGTFAVNPAIGIAVIIGIGLYEYFYSER